MGIPAAFNDLSGSTIAATLVQNLDNVKLIQIPNALTTDNLNAALFENIQLVDMENLPIAVESENISDNYHLNCSNQYSDGLELVNYRVELMDQFELRNETSNMLQNANTLNIDGMDDPNRNTDVVFSYLYSDDFSINDLPMEVMETLERPLSKQEASFMNTTDDSYEHEQICRTLNDTQLDSYTNWLNSVIETTNFVLDFNGDGNPDPIIFSVPHVSLTFSFCRLKFNCFIVFFFAVLL